MKEDLNSIEELENEMANVGKYFAYVLGIFVLAFLILAFAKEKFIEIFLDWSLKVVYAIVGGTVIYIIVKVVNKK